MDHVNGGEQEDRPSREQHCVTRVQTEELTQTEMLDDRNVRSASYPVPLEAGEIENGACVVEVGYEDELVDCDYTADWDGECDELELTTRAGSAKARRRVGAGVVASREHEAHDSEEQPSENSSEERADCEDEDTMVMRKRRSVKREFANALHAVSVRLLNCANESS